MLEFFGKRLRYMQEVKRDERGFTLIELLVVVIIIGILAAIAIPVFLNQRQNAYEAQTQADIRNAVTNAESYAATNGGTYDPAGTPIMAQADIQQGISTDNTTLALRGVSATAYCIQGTNVTDTTVVYRYLKADDDITEAACPA